MNEPIYFSVIFEIENQVSYSESEVFIRFRTDDRIRLVDII